MNLTQYIIRRLLFAIPVIFIVTVLSFLIIHMAPGEPIELLVNPRMLKNPEIVNSIRKKYGLNKPLYIQYFVWLKNICRGDLGKSLYLKQPISNLLMQRWPNSLNLALAGLFISYIIGVPAGIISAINRGTALDFFSMLFALVGLAIPSFWLALLLMLVFSVNLGWFPIGGYGSLRALVLPAIAYGAYSAAENARVTRSSMLEVLNKDYIRTARAKGLVERVVLYKHAFRNALIPLISLLGMRINWLLGGAVAIEVVFARPGLGRLLVNSVYRRDYPVIQILILLFAIGVVFGNLAADVLYALSDPQITYD
ncbi:MAG: ABC transporter permease [Candidatus Bipolaricaulia bacterium]